MRHLRFPFWIIEHRDRQESHLLSFSDRDKAVSYLDADRGDSGEVKIVNRSTLPELLQHLQAHGVTVLYHDRNADGTGGREIPLADLLREFP